MRHHDFSAVVSLVKRYEKPLYRYLYKLVGRAEVAEDLLQDVFIRCYEKQHRYDREKALAPWLFRLAHNLAIDYLRRAGRLVSMEDFTEQPHELDEGQNPQTKLEKKQMQQKLAKVFAKLPEKVRLVLWYHYFDDLSVKSIAERMEMPVGSVLSHLSRGRKKLKTIFVGGQHYFDIESERSAFNV